MMLTDHRTRTARGQIVVLFALGLVALIAMVGLVIDGSNLFAEQRIAQNGADAAANAGAIVVAEKLAGKTRTQANVFHAIDRAARANGLADYTAEYTDDLGVPIGATVTDSAAALPSTARGVIVGGERVTGTTFARAIGIASLTRSAGTAWRTRTDARSCRSPSRCTCSSATAMAT
jgi:Flp pilus assembly protein TadG